MSEDDPPYEVDRWPERFLETSAPRGYLRRTGGRPPRGHRQADFVVGGLEDFPPSQRPERPVDRSPSQGGGLPAAIGMPSGAEASDPSGASSASKEQLLRMVGARDAAIAQLRARLDAITRSRTYRWSASLRRLPVVGRLGSGRR